MMEGSVICRAIDQNSNPGIARVEIQAVMFLHLGREWVSSIWKVCGDVPAQERGAVGSKLCGEAPCGFADAKSTLKDTQERSAAMKKLCIAVVLCVVFMTVEVIGGIKANSLAILTDAAHLLSDVAAFAISLFSLWVAGWEATPRQSYGFFRIEILGALVSIQMIWLLAGILVYEAVDRLINDTGEVQGSLMFAVSAFGDSIQSVGVMIGGAIIWYKPEWKIIDLFCTLIFSVLVLGTTIRMIRNILEVLMESTPREIDATRLEKGLCEMEEVVAVHELHIWAIIVGKVLLACHVKIKKEADADIVLDKVSGLANGITIREGVKDVAEWRPNAAGAFTFKSAKKRRQMMVQVVFESDDRMVLEKVAGYEGVSEHEGTSQIFQSADGVGRWKYNTIQGTLRRNGHEAWPPVVHRLRIVHLLDMRLCLERAEDCLQMGMRLAWRAWGGSVAGSEEECWFGLRIVCFRRNGHEA
nr:metal tolerance protein 1-like [Ipomoea batatas]